MPARAVRVLYFDLESPESVYRYHVESVGRSENLAFVRTLPQTLNSENGRAEFLQVCRHFEPDVVFLDPVPIAWPVKDENDNAEADAQISAIKKMAVEIGCLYVALWNMGEGNPKDKFKARGATARIDRCDLALNYTELTETTRQLKVVKSRYGTLGQTLSLRFAGNLGFEAVDSTVIPNATALVEYQQRIRGIEQEGKVTRKDAVGAMGNEDMVDKALSRMVMAGEYSRGERGVYLRQISSEPPSIGGKDSEETPREAEVVQWTR